MRWYIMLSSFHDLWPVVSINSGEKSLSVYFHLANKKENAVTEVKLWSGKWNEYFLYWHKIYTSIKSSLYPAHLCRLALLLYKALVCSNSGSHSAEQTNQQENQQNTTEQCINKVDGEAGFLDRRQVLPAYNQKQGLLSQSRHVGVQLDKSLEENCRFFFVVCLVFHLLITSLYIYMKIASACMERPCRVSTAAQNVDLRRV